jgi:hypothetical protein
MPADLQTRCPDPAVAPGCRGRRTAAARRAPTARRRRRAAARPRIAAARPGATRYTSFLRRAAAAADLTQGLTTPSLKGTGSETECRFTPRARILLTRVSTSASANSVEKERSGQLGPEYLHIVTSRHRSGWTRRLMKVRRRSAPTNPSRSKL